MGPSSKPQTGTGRAGGASLSPCALAFPSSHFRVLRADSGSRRDVGQSHGCPRPPTPHSLCSLKTSLMREIDTWLHPGPQEVAVATRWPSCRPTGGILFGLITYFGCLTYRRCPGLRCPVSTFDSCSYPWKCQPKPRLAFVPQPLGRSPDPGQALCLLPGGPSLQMGPEWAWGIGSGALSPPHPHSLPREGRTPFYSFLVCLFKVIYHS